MKKILFSIFICFCSILLMSHNAGAIEFMKDVELVQGNFQFTMRANSWSCFNDSSCPSWDNSTFYRSFSSFGANITDIDIRIPNRSYAAGDWLVFDFYFFHSNTLANHSIFDGLKTTGATSNYIDIIDVKFEQLTDNSSHATVFSRFFKNSNISGLHLLGNATLFQLQSASTAQYKAEVDAGILTIWHEKSGTDYTNTINNITDQIQEQTQQQAEQNEKENEAVENIENQSPSDMDVGSDQSATNLIGAFSGFVSALGGLSATNCNLTLDFPSFAGGSRVVNVCQNKDKAGNIISVFSSLTLIIFYVPLAIRLLTMIYNEIRSFTNG